MFLLIKVFTELQSRLNLAGTDGVLAQTMYNLALNSYSKLTLM